MSITISLCSLRGIGHIHNETTHIQFLIILPKNNGLINQDDKATMNWLFNRIFGHDILMTQNCVPLYYYVNVYLKYVIFKSFQVPFRVH
jgi:hypothetical protein